SITMRNHMSKFPCKRTLPTKKLRLMNYRATNASTISKEKKVAMPFTYTERIFTKACCIDVILNFYRHFKSLFQNFLNCNSIPSWNVDRSLDYHTCFCINHASNRDSNRIKR